MCENKQLSFCIPPVLYVSANAKSIYVKKTHFLKKPKRKVLTRKERSDILNKLSTRAAAGSLKIEQQDKQRLRKFF